MNRKKEVRANRGRTMSISNGSSTLLMNQKKKKTRKMKGTKLMSPSALGSDVGEKEPKNSVNDLSGIDLHGAILWVERALCQESKGIDGGYNQIINRAEIRPQEIGKRPKQIEKTESEANN
jgi:hypothetical protein